MEKRDFDEIGRFLATVRKPTLFEYFDVENDAAESVVLLALKKKRAWAQGQQSNPKFRGEALWVIKNMGLARRALIEQRADYLGALKNRHQARHLEVLNLFLMGTLADGVLTQKGEAAVRAQGRKLGLDDDVISARIEELLKEQGAVREDAPAEADEDVGPFVDHFATLDAQANADQATLESAYRAKYRWARNLKDKKRTAEVYAELDRAWRVLKDPDRRAKYLVRWKAEQAKAKAKKGGPSEGGTGPTMYLPPPAAEAAEPAPPKPESRPLSLEGERTPPPVRRLPDYTETPPPRRAQPSPTDPPSSDGVRLGTNPPAATPTPPPTGPASAPPPPTPAASSKPPAPTPPQQFTGRTLSLGASGQTARPNVAPRLEVPGPDTVSVRLGKTPTTVAIEVRNAGTGRMPGRVFADREWLDVTPSRLDANAASQSVEVTVDPRLMPRRKAVSMVTVVADHGERRAVTIEAEQRTLIPVIAAVLALAGLVFGAAVVGIMAIQASAEPEVVPAAVSVLVDVTPSAGEVYLDDDLVTAEGDTVLTAGLTAGTPAQLRVELDGFETWTQTVTPVADEPMTVEARLKLTDPMDFVPVEGQKQAEVDLVRVRELLKGRERQFAQCFEQHLSGAAGFVAKLEVVAYVSPRGYISGVDWTNANFDEPKVTSCLLSELRAVRLPMHSGDYAAFQYSFDYVMPASPQPGQ